MHTLNTIASRDLETYILRRIIDERVYKNEAGAPNLYRRVCRVAMHNGNHTTDL